VVFLGGGGGLLVERGCAGARFTGGGFGSVVFWIRPRFWMGLGKSLGFNFSAVFVVVLYSYAGVERKLRSRFNRELFCIVKAPLRRRWILTSLFIARHGHSNLPWPPSPSLPTSPPSSSSCCKASQTPDTETAADQTDYHPSHTAPDADSASTPSSYAG